MVVDAVVGVVVVVVAAAAVVVGVGGQKTGRERFRLGEGSWKELDSFLERGGGVCQCVGRVLSSISQSCLKRSWGLKGSSAGAPNEIVTCDKKGSGCYGICIS